MYITVSLYNYILTRVNFGYCLLLAVFILARICHVGMRYLIETKSVATLIRLDCDKETRLLSDTS